MMLVRTLLVFTILVGTAYALDGPPTHGEVISTGSGVTCAKMVEVWRKLRVKSLPCHDRHSVRDLDLKGGSVVLSMHTQDGSYRWNGERVSCHELNTRLRKLGLEKYRKLAVRCPNGPKSN
jgi:hypothetical protein